MPYISVNHSLRIDLSAHSFSEPFTVNSFYGQNDRLDAPGPRNPRILGRVQLASN